MDIAVSFPGGKRVDAHAGGFTIHTDQPLSAGGDASAPAPFDLFLASLATCAGLYVLAFFEARSLSTDGLTIVQHVEYDAATKLPTRIALALGLPPSFPPKYVASVVRAAEGCKVKKAVAAQPRVEVVAAIARPA